MTSFSSISFVLLYYIIFLLFSYSYLFPLYYFYFASTLGIMTCEVLSLGSLLLLLLVILGDTEVMEGKFLFWIIYFVNWVNSSLMLYPVLADTSQQFIGNLSLYYFKVLLKGTLCSSSRSTLLPTTVNTTSVASMN